MCGQLGIGDLVMHSHIRSQKLAKKYCACRRRNVAADCLRGVCWVLLLYSVAVKRHVGCSYGVVVGARSFRSFPEAEIKDAGLFSKGRGFLGRPVAVRQIQMLLRTRIQWHLSGLIQLHRSQYLVVRKSGRMWNSLVVFFRSLLWVHGSSDLSES